MFQYKEVTSREKNAEKQYMKGKGKLIPLQAWRDPKGSRRFRLPDFKIIGT